MRPSVSFTGIRIRHRRRLRLRRIPAVSGVFVAVVGFLAPSACAQDRPDGSASPARESVTGRVIRVIDGDTILVEGVGRVRLLGVDSPESVDPRREVQPFGREAAAYTRARLEGRRVRLEFDLKRRDRFGRTLAYVFLSDGTLFNELLLHDGYAHVYTGHPYARMESFRAAQRDARQAGRGLWKDGAEEGSRSEH